jgi:hypothetical protein
MFLLKALRPEVPRVTSSSPRRDSTEDSYRGDFTILERSANSTILRGHQPKTGPTWNFPGFAARGANNRQTDAREARCL